MTAHCDRLNCFKYDLKADIKFVYKTFSNGLPFSKSGPVHCFGMGPIVGQLCPRLCSNGSVKSLIAAPGGGTFSKWGRQLETPKDLHSMA